MQKEQLMTGDIIVNSAYPITILAQAFYGNRTLTQVFPDQIDRFILGYVDESSPVMKPIDRTVIEVPDTDGIVIIYNKFSEEEAILDGRKWYEEEGYVMKPLAEIPELDLKIYSKCIACRMDEGGELKSLGEGDCEVVVRYLAE